MRRRELRKDGCIYDIYAKKMVKNGVGKRFLEKEWLEQSERERRGKGGKCGRNMGEFNTF